LLWRCRPIRKARRYEVVLSPESVRKELGPKERREALELPPSISPAVRELAESWAAKSSNPRTIINSALQFFRTEGFTYSLSPGEFRKDDLEQFLFHRRVGFCGHYATSFATLMRLAGIPARVVVGYLGGEYNERGPFVLIMEILIAAVALLVIYFSWMQLRSRSRADRVKALYERFCRKAARLGVRRDPWEGPSDFSNRAALLLPGESGRIQQISN